MRFKFAFTLLLMVAVLSGALAIASFASEVYYPYRYFYYSVQLLENTHEHDGKQVQIDGEVIGDIMRRGKYAWVNIENHGNAIGVFMPIEMANKIKYAGSYKFKGDRVRVSGVFNRACKQHGGDLDIHAMELKIYSVGHKVEHPLKTSRVIMLFFMIALVIVLIIIRVVFKR